MPAIAPPIPNPISPQKATAVGKSAWELARVAIDRAAQSGQKTLLVLSFTAPAGDPLAWLSGLRAVPSMYWRSRDGWEYAGVGAAHAIGGHGAQAIRINADKAMRFLADQVVAEHAPQARRPRFFGGFSFDPGHSSSSEWSDGGLGDAVLILPEAMYARKESQSYVFFAFDVTSRTTPESLVEKLAVLNAAYWRGFDTPLDGSSTTPFDYEPESRQKTAWVKEARSIIDRINRNELKKVVLARRIRLTWSDSAEQTVHPWPTVAALRSFDPSCYGFGFQLGEGCAFVGASPERLFRLDGRTLQSEALAGTAPRGTDNSGDQWLAERLLTSAKDQLEHRLVVEELRSALGELTADNDSLPLSDKQEVVRLRTLQHLRSLFSTQIRAEITVGRILESLHPTAAVAGVPRAAALEAIRGSEDAPRGWYGGPVGWIGADAAEFAVGIRSALIRAGHAWVYAGAGLVDGSVPEDEWHETQDKLQAFLSAVSQPRPTLST